MPLGLAGFAVLIMVVFTWRAGRKGQGTAQIPNEPAPVGPRILVHDINDDRCTGCDACVAVCPTNVLDLIANKSRVLRFHDCIQCEACMVVCPTEALVMFPQGTTPPSIKVPELDEHYQSVVPGQYLIGEVAGKPLLKNAANIGRAVIEHMVATGLGRGAGGAGSVDVAIIGSGPGGLSAAMSCVQRGLSYVVLEKEQMIASTIARYPKGKLVMAEPYDTQNVSLLPVFDGSKEIVIAVWKELCARVGVTVKTGESVEGVARGPDGMFEVRTTVSRYRAQRVVLSVGTRGKPRTLQVPEENLPKVRSLLEDPDEWRARAVLVVGGGDSACEAALALADAGARVIISYRGKGFNRAAPANKQTIEQYANEGRIRAYLGSQVLGFDPEGVTLALADGSQHRFANDGAFVLIGSDPPIVWLEGLGIRSVERPHQYALGKTDDLVRRFSVAPTCPEDAANAAAQILGTQGAAPAAVPEAAPAKGPRKWLQSATSIFRNPATNPGLRPPPAPPVAEALAPSASAPRVRVPFGPRGGAIVATVVVHHAHSGSGRRDQLSMPERTRVLRMLRDDGARLADDDSEHLYIGNVPAGRFDLAPLEDLPVPPPPPMAVAMAPTAPEPRLLRRTPVPVIDTDDDEGVHIGERPSKRWPTIAPATEPSVPLFDRPATDTTEPPDYADEHDTRYDAGPAEVRPQFIASIGSTPSRTRDEDENDEEP